MARKAGKKRVSSPKMKGDTGPAAPENENPVSIPAPAVASAQQIQEAIDNVIAKHEADKKAATHRTGTKLGLSKEIAACAKVTGFEKDDIKWGLEQRERPVEEIDAETRRRTRIAGYFKMKIGGQLGLLEDGTSVADMSERDKLKDSDPQILAACEAQGQQAGIDGANYASCAYPEGSKRRAKWQAGWKLGNAENAPAATTKQPTHESAHA